MRDELATTGRASPRVLVISFAPTDQLEQFRRHLELPFPIASDPDHAAYASYGLGRASRWQVWHPAVMLHYASTANLTQACTKSLSLRLMLKVKHQ